MFAGIHCEIHLSQIQCLLVYIVKYVCFRSNVCCPTLRKVFPTSKIISHMITLLINIFRQRIVHDDILWLLFAPNQEVGHLFYFYFAFLLASLQNDIIHNYHWLGGVSSISGTLKECVGNHFRPQRLIIIIIND